MSNSWTITDPGSSLDLDDGPASAPIAPGEMLRDHFMTDMGLSSADVARAMGVEAARVDAILTGQAALTAEDSVRLGHAFQMSDGFWMRLQNQFDVERARAELAGALASLPVLVAA